jgi:Fic family protein
MGRGSVPVAKKGKGGRLARRSPAEIARTLGTIVTLLKGKKAGLRSEEIRKVLKLDVREVPRVLKEGLAKKAIKSKGQKRATVYTAA